MQPREAVDACSGKAADDICGFSTNGRGVNGTCRERQSGVIACTPENPGIPSLQGAADACQGMEENATCKLAYQGNEIQGICRTSRTNALRCQPGAGQMPSPRNASQQGMRRGQGPPAGHPPQ
jgi:hypothetical protein